MQPTNASCDSHHFARSIGQTCEDLDSLWRAYRLETFSERAVRRERGRGSRQTDGDNSNNTGWDMRGTGSEMIALQYVRAVFSRLRVAVEGRSGNSDSSNNDNDKDIRGEGGFLIPLSCGHSGWPDKRALTALDRCLAKSGCVEQSQSQDAVGGGQIHGKGDEGEGEGEEGFGSYFPKMADRVFRS